MYIKRIDLRNIRKGSAVIFRLKRCVSIFASPGGFNVAASWQPAFVSKQVAPAKMVDEAIALWCLAKSKSVTGKVGWFYLKTGRLFF